MVTNSDVIRDALGLIGVLNEIQDPSAEQGAHGLRVLNDMVNDWEANGISLQWFDQTDTTAECPLSGSVLGAVKRNLALELAPYYGRKVDAAAFQIASTMKSSVLLQSTIDSMRESGLKDLPHPRFLNTYDITKG